MARSDADRYSSEALVRYRLLRETRRGGMSQIWEAIDTQTGRRVAVKRLSVPTTLTPSERRAWITQIERTAQEIARLKHPNIAAIYDVGQENGQPFLVMDLLPGRTLRERLREGPLPPGEAARVLVQAAAALDAAHDIGLVHGGLKPASFLLLPNSTMKLMDFGVARQEDSALVLPTGKTTADTMIGAPSYLSPEQIQGAPLGPASDIWALGVILYEMLAGYPPFSGSRMEAVLEEITTGSLPPVPRMSLSIQTVLSRALAKEPSQRYGQAGELAAAVQDALLPSLPSAPPLSALRSSLPAPASPAAAVRSALLRPSRIRRRVLLALAGASLLGMILLALHTHHPPIARSLPAVPTLPMETVLPVPQPPPAPPAEDLSPFTPVPAPPVLLPVTEPPPAAKKHQGGVKHRD